MGSAWLECTNSLVHAVSAPSPLDKQDRFPCMEELLTGVPSAYEEFVSIRNRFKNFAVILYI